MLTWILSPEGISTVILIVTLFFGILTFQYAYRPYVGVVESNCQFYEDSNEISVEVKIKNTGNIPANSVQTNMKMLDNFKLKQIHSGNSKFVLFPGQQTYETAFFQDVNKKTSDKSYYEIVIEIKYQHAIRF